MKKITLKHLKLINFKGIRDLSVDFEKVTNIYGDNGTGKTTIFDAFLWLLFGKDSTDRKDFEIKTLDESNRPFHKMSHEVTALLEVDGDEVTIRRTYKENWPTKKGTATETFSGHTTNFYWNDVPLPLNEFQKKVSMIMDEGLFKLLTNTGYFANMKWQDRRVVLEQLAGEITNQMVFDALPGVEFTDLIKALTAKKSVQEYKNEISAKKKLIRDEKDLLPSRIDEAKRSLPDFVNYDTVENEVEKLKAEVVKIDDLLNNKTLALQEKQNVINGKIREMQTLSNQAKEIEFAERNKVQQNKRERDQVIANDKSLGTNKRQSLESVVRDIQNDTARKTSLQNQQQELRTKWASIDAEKLEFKQGEFNCPTCKREYDATNVEAKKTELTQNFNQNKSTRLTEITDRGKQLAKEVGEIDVRLAGYETNRTAIQNDIDALINKIKSAEEENTKLSANDEQVYQSAMDAHLDYQKLIGQINGLNGEINTPISADDNTELLNKKRVLNIQMEGLNQHLSSKGQREKIEKRIVELTNQESEMANELARLEGIEYSILQFEKAKMDMLEERVNKMFKVVKFKMFEEQINGGEVPCCIALIDGVPYSDANTASKIQAGIDIINTLSQYHNISAPIFIDNRESCFKIPESQSQIISLIASLPDKKLRIEKAAA